MCIAELPGTRLKAPAGALREKIPSRRARRLAVTRRCRRGRAAARRGSLPASDVDRARLSLLLCRPRLLLLLLPRSRCSLQGLHEQAFPAPRRAEPSRHGAGTPPDQSLFLLPLPGRPAPRSCMSLRAGPDGLADTEPFQDVSAPASGACRSYASPGRPPAPAGPPRAPLARSPQGPGSPTWRSGGGLLAGCDGGGGWGAAVGRGTGLRGEGRPGRFSQHQHPLHPQVTDFASPGAPCLAQARGKPGHVCPARDWRVSQPRQLRGSFLLVFPVLQGNKARKLEDQAGPVSLPPWPLLFPHYWKSKPGAGAPPDSNPPRPPSGHGHTPPPSLALRPGGFPLPGPCPGSERRGDPAAACALCRARRCHPCPRFWGRLCVWGGGDVCRTQRPCLAALPRPMRVVLLGGASRPLPRLSEGARAAR